MRSAPTVLLEAWAYGAWLLSEPCPHCGMVHTGNRAAPRHGRCDGLAIEFVVQSGELPHRIEAVKYKEAYGTVAKHLKWLMVERRGLPGPLDRDLPPRQRRQHARAG